MRDYIMNNMYWIVPSIATIIAAILTMAFSKQIKEKVKLWRLGNIKLKKSNNNNNNNSIQIITNQFDNELKSDYKKEQTIIAYHRIFELTDALIRLSTDAFRPIKYHSSKSFADYLNETIDKFNEYVVYFDSKEILFEDNVVKIVHSIREIILKCIKHQKTIEDFKAMKMPWEYITPEIEALHDIYYNQIENELPELRKSIKEIVKNK